MFYSYNNISNTIILYIYTHKEGVLRVIALIPLFLAGISC